MKSPGRSRGSSHSVHRAMTKGNNYHPSAACSLQHCDLNSRRILSGHHPIRPRLLLTILEVLGATLSDQVLLPLTSHRRHRGHPPPSITSRGLCTNQKCTTGQQHHSPAAYGQLSRVRYLLAIGIWRAIIDQSPAADGLPIRTLAAAAVAASTPLARGTIQADIPGHPTWQAKNTTTKATPAAIMTQGQHHRRRHSTGISCTTRTHSTPASRQRQWRPRRSRPRTGLAPRSGQEPTSCRGSCGRLNCQVRDCAIFTTTGATARR